MKNKAKTYKKDHTYYCELTDEDGRIYIGRAKCCPEDYDFENDITGFTIAEKRALIKALKGAKLKANHEFKALKNYYNKIRYNKHYNEKHQPYSTIIKIIEEKKDDINMWQYIIDIVSEDIKSFIAEKEKLYNKIRKNRNKN